MPIPSDSPRPRALSPRAVRRLISGLALVLWTGWAPMAPAAAEPWIRPVPDAVARAFSLGADPYARGRHRGVDLAAGPGAEVRSACTGVVVFAGVLPEHGRALSVRCGRWRVSYLPFAATTVRRGRVVAAGMKLGSVGRGHKGLHIGVRREGRRLGYVDPLSRFAAGPPPPAAVRPPGLGRAPRPSRPPPPPVLHPVTAPARPATAAATPLAPWPAWLGLALLLTGAAGGRTVARRRVTPRRPTFFHTPRGHDSWVVGDEPYISLQITGSEDHAAIARTGRPRARR